MPNFIGLHIRRFFLFVQRIYACSVDPEYCSSCQDNFLWHKVRKIDIDLHKRVL